MTTNEPPVGPDPDQPEGSVPPPPPPSYGSTQYPPPADPGAGAGGTGGYGAAGGYPPPPPSDPGFTAPFSAPDAIGFGWKKFTGNAGNWVIAGLVVFAVLVLFGFLTWLVGPKFESRTTVNGGVAVVQTGGSTILSWLVQIAASIVGILFTGVLVRGALDETEGRKFSLGDALGRIPAGPVIVTAIIVGLSVSVLSIIPILGDIAGIVIQFFTWFALTFVIDKGQDPITGIKSSFSLVTSNVGQSLLLALLSVLVILLGCCGLLAMITIPIVSIASAYAYKRFQNLTVA